MFTMRLLFLIIIIFIFFTFPVSGCAPPVQTTTNEINTGVPTATIKTPSVSTIKSEAPTPPSTVPTKADPWTNGVRNSELIVLGTITDKEYEVVTVGEGERAGKRAYTIFTCMVEKVIKGAPDTKEVLIKVDGGKIDDNINQSYTGAFFSIDYKILVSLIDKEGNTYIYPAVLWRDDNDVRTKPIINLEETLGRILKIMLDNDIPVTLPHSEWPPIPTGPVIRPAQ